ncbi:LOB domain-containing protein 15 [Ricinus communis]|uniref:LOB domain-containing protein, putative n=1 Tax=Ricinus communis TaxID=3988 RepID=B9RVF1_RICCO|nr:LOB domain-containing protein 15 [Ricinus communis]EEF44652.1 LOB domain-containing protein, putative [Ricinus communis]|eukprot:XP_002517720.1 LOB domain-containing protein 15 [Ricinus communis]
MSTDRDRFDEIGKNFNREISDPDASPPMGRRHALTPPPGFLNTVTPCAACKLLRRRCAEECPFSPYFSPHEPRKFAAVHKVFGASNVSKMLMEVPDSQRADTANSLVYEANLRIRDPVYGCMGAISALQQQIQSLQAELTAVRSEIIKYKYREATSNFFPSTAHDALVSSGSLLSITAEPSKPTLTHPPPPPPPPPTSPPAPPPSTLVSSSSISTLYTPSPSSMGYSSINFQC